MAELLNIHIFPVVLTIAAFQIGRLVQKKWPIALCNPTLIGMLLVVLFLIVSPMEPEAYQQDMGLLSWLMTPATICLAIPMYEQFRVLRKNLGAIVLGVSAGAACSLVGLWAGGRLLGLGETLTVSLMPKSVTTAIGVPLSELFGGLGGVTTAAIIVTGISANMLGPWLCRLFGITDEIAKGAAFGTAGHVIGTAKAGELSELAGAVSSLSLAAAGILTAVAFPLLAG